MRDAVSVLGNPLEPCSGENMPTTGFTRTGKCAPHKDDKGSHHVCLRNISSGDFCRVTRQDNWCAKKNNWCVCEWAFDTAVTNAGCDKFDIKCDATNQLALDHYSKTDKKAAADCIRRQCQLA